MAAAANDPNALPAVPPEFKKIKAYIRRAEEVVCMPQPPSQNILIAFYLRKYAMTVASRLPRTQQESTDFLVALMNKLEHDQQYLTKMNANQEMAKVADHVIHFSVTAIYYRYPDNKPR